MSSEEYSNSEDLKGKFYNESDEIDDSSNSGYKFTYNIKINENNNKEKNVNNQNKKNNENNPEFNIPVKCYICSNYPVEPLMCRFCSNIACEKCFLDKSKYNIRCKCCFRKLIKEDLVPIPILSKIKNFLINNNNKNEIDKCLKHDEKILYYCVNCVKKFCGKCLCFTSEEAKNHIGHKILDFKDIKKSQYNELINEIESGNETLNKINRNSEAYNNYRLENKIKLDKSIFTLHSFKNAIFSDYDKKNCIINKYSNDLKKAKNEINEIYTIIADNLKKIENLENPLENFDIKKINENLKNKIQKVKDIEKEIETLKNTNKELEFKNLLFQITKNKSDIIRSKEKSISIISPINIEIKMEDDSNFSINIPETYNIKKENKIIYLFPMITFKNKFYDFKQIKSKDVNNSMDSEGEINNINDESFRDYKILINIKELDDGINIFNFNVYTYSLY